MQVKKQQLEPYMEYVKSVYCHPAYLTYTHSTACKLPEWMKHKLETPMLDECTEKN